MVRRTSSIPRSQAGITLIESTLVILVLLVLVSVLFASARAWKKGSDRTVCVLSQHQVQQAVRGFANLYGKPAGEEVPDLAMRLFGEGKFIEGVPLCPSGGIYSYSGNLVPIQGELYMKCSLAGIGHAPNDAEAW
jgi:type II secretory pathway pseudopilin PulG